MLAFVHHMRKARKRSRVMARSDLHGWTFVPFFARQLIIAAVLVLALGVMAWPTSAQGTLDQQQTTAATGAVSTLGSVPVNHLQLRPIAQTFTARSPGLLDTIALQLGYQANSYGVDNAGNPAPAPPPYSQYPLTVSLRTVTDQFSLGSVLSNVPSGTVLAQTTLVAPWSQDANGFVYVTFANPPGIAAGQRYAIVLQGGYYQYWGRYSDVYIRYSVGFTASDPYSPGQQFVDATGSLQEYYPWVAADGDWLFKTFVTLTADQQPPTVVATASGASGSSGWHRGPVTLDLSASDSSGVEYVSYSATGANPLSTVSTLGSTATVTLNKEGETNVTYAAIDNDGNMETPQTLLVKIDMTSPVVSCNATSGVWSATDVQIGCAASDAVSGLTGATNLVLTTSVPAGTETASAATNRVQVYDRAGNYATAGPVSGNMIDKKPPIITPSVPVSNQVFLLHQPIVVGYTCSDGGSGVQTCTGQISSGAYLNTATVGSKSLQLSSTDKVGNAANPVLPYSVAYKIGRYFLPPQTNIAIQLLDYTGTNVSSATIPVTALCIVPSSTTTCGSRPLLKAPFAFTTTGPARVVGGVYTYKVDMKGLSKGTEYALLYQASGDPTIHSATFVR
jgi:hypothetical protein